MGQPPQYRLSLRPDGTNYFAIVNGNVVVQPTPYYIEDPVGWDEVAITNARNLELSGLDRDFTIPYKFIGDGAKILRFIDYTTRGSEGVCRLFIEVRDPVNWTYLPFTPNPLDLDFSTANDEGFQFTIATKEAGAAAMIRANLDTEYQVPIFTNPNARYIDVKPLIAQAEIKWVTETLAVNYPTPNPNADGHITDTYDRTIHLVTVKKTFVPTSDGGDYSPVKMGQLTTANSPQLGAPEGQYPTPRLLTGNFNQNANTGFPYMFMPKVALTNVVVKGSFDVKLVNNTGSQMTLNFKVTKLTFPGGGANPIETDVWTSPNHVATNGVPLNFTENILTAPFSMAAGEELIIYYRSNGVKTSGSFDITIQQGRYVSATFRYATQQFRFLGLKGSDVLNYLVMKATDGKYTASSTLLGQLTHIIDSIPNNIHWTSGLAIRSQPTGSTLLGNTFLKISLGDFFRTYNCLYGAGLSIENNVVRIERKSSYFDKNTVVYDLGTIPDRDCSISKGTEFQFHTIKSGYAKQTYDQVNGLDEFNTTQTFTNGGIRSSKTLDLVSPVRADMWGIFFEWVKYVQEETKDSNSDSDTFIIETKSAPNSNGYYEPVTGADIVSMTGVIDPINAFNMTLSPKRNLLRNGGVIRGGNYPFETDVLTFQDTDKNQEMQSNRFSGVIAEKANVTINTLSAPYFYPYIFTLNVPSPDNLLALLDANPYGVFTFFWRGRQLEGFCLQASITPAKPETAQMRLLCSPNVNLADLQNIPY